MFDSGTRRGDFVGMHLRSEPVDGVPRAAWILLYARRGLTSWLEIFGWLNVAKSLAGGKAAAETDLLLPCLGAISRGIGSAVAHIDHLAYPS